MKKSIFKSKTFWVNTIAGLVAVIALINPEFLNIFVSDENQKMKLLTIIGTLTAILNILLRAITTKPVRIIKEK